MEAESPKYKRVLLKLSGEALSGDKGSGLDIPTIENICASIKKCVDAGAEIGIVVGGGNFWLRQKLRGHGQSACRPYRNARYRDECSRSS